MPSIRAELVGDRLVVSADGPVEHVTLAASVHDALAAWSDRYARAVPAAPLRPTPTVWCSWYHYFTDVTEADVVENIEAVARLDLPVDVVQIRSPPTSTAASNP